MKRCSEHTLSHQAWWMQTTNAQINLNIASTVCHHGNTVSFVQLKSSSPAFSIHRLKHFKNIQKCSVLCLEHSVSYSFTLSFELLPSIWFHIFLSKSLSPSWFLDSGFPSPNTEFAINKNNTKFSRQLFIILSNFQLMFYFQFQSLLAHDAYTFNGFCEAVSFPLSFSKNAS